MTEDGRTPRQGPPDQPVRAGDGDNSLSDSVFRGPTSVVVGPNARVENHFHTGEDGLRDARAHTAELEKLVRQLRDRYQEAQRRPQADHLAVLAEELARAGEELGRARRETEQLRGQLRLVSAGSGAPALTSAARPPDWAEQELWVGKLVEQIVATEGPQLALLTGGDTERINLRFTLRAQPGRNARASAAEGRMRRDGLAVPDIAEFYRGTRPRRLLITGPAGGGKTVLALELVLALLERRSAADPVPVRLPLPQWNTEASLDEFVVQHLVEVFQCEQDAAKRLVERRLILPVLDGLDEMDLGAADAPTAGPPGGSDGDAAAREVRAPRARAALKELNKLVRGRHPLPLVVTCRSDEYQALAGDSARLRDAAHVVIDGVDAIDAAAYLQARAQDEERWAPLLHALRTDTAGGLSELLSTPWRLCMLATVYHATGDPARVAGSSPETLEQELLARFVAETTALHAGRHGPDPRQVHRQLAYVARAAQVGKDSRELNASRLALLTSGGYGVVVDAQEDLAMHQLWPIAGRQLVPLVDGLVTFLLVMLAGLVPGTTARTLGSDALTAAAIGILNTVLPVRRPRRLDLRGLRRPLGRRLARRRLAWCWPGLAAASCLMGFGAGRQAGWQAGVGAAVAWGLGVTVLFVCSGFSSSVSRPMDLVWEDLRLGAAYGVLGAALGCSFVLGTEERSFPDRISLGLALGISLMLAMTSAGRRYLAFLLCARRHLPLRLGRFMDWAYHAGLLRRSGPTYQLRHRALQEWLVRHPEPPGPTVT